MLTVRQRYGQTDGRTDGRLMIAIPRFALRASRGKKEVIQGCTPGSRSRGRQRRRWTDDISEWSGMTINDAARVAEDRAKWSGDRSCTPPTLHMEVGSTRQRRQEVYISAVRSITQIHKLPRRVFQSPVPRWRAERTGSRRA